MLEFADVAIPVGVRRTFTYQVPAGLRERMIPGVRVLVPFGRKLVTGFVVGVTKSPPGGKFRVRAVQDIIDPDAPLPQDLVETAMWVARRYFTAPGAVLQALLPAGTLASGTQAVELEPGTRNLLAGGLIPSGLSRDQEKILDALTGRETLDASQLAAKTGVRGLSAHLDELARRGHIRMTAQVAGPRVKEKQQLGVRVRTAEANADKPLTKAQRRLLAFLDPDGRWDLLQEALRRAEVSSQVARGLALRGSIEIAPLTVSRNPIDLEENVLARIPVLTEAQVRVFEQLKAMLSTGRPARCLLHGVTGSGKTEVYIRLIAEALSRGGEALLLVPEIGLTPLLSRLMVSRFPGQVALLHSGMSQGERFDQWNRVRRGEAPVVVGTRSAIFSPLRKLRLVIIDEEQDPSYKQDESPYYHAREVAWHRLQRSGGVLLMGSATPSVETYYAAIERKELNYLSLPERIEARPLAQVDIVDMGLELQRHGRKAVISGALRGELASCLRRHQQAIVLLNRRGYARTMLCRSCGHVVTCSSCSISMTYHQEERLLICHYCGDERQVPEKCSACGGQYVYFVGVGTEQLEEILRASLPSARIARVDRDSVRRRGSLRKVLLDFAEGRIDLLVGTQMVAKGHDFPKVTLVGVVSADADLGFPDFRTAERTFQLLTQVAGRAGRGESAGKVIIQSYYPEHYALRFARNQDYRGFWEREVEFRQLMGYPPFVNLVQILVSHPDSSKAYRIGEKVAAALKSHGSRSGAESRPHVLGPAAAPFEKIRGNFRVQVLIKMPIGADVIPLLADAFDELSRQKLAMKYVEVDVDPLSLM
jgi:primosomal protein N' (replication factor Y) (superfamily II helicase)